MEVNMTFEEFTERYLDYILVPSGLFVMIAYHAWLLFNITRRPSRTVIGLNTMCRHRWVYNIMSDQTKNGILGVQTLRNNLMASTLLATISITLSSLIGAVISSSSKPSDVTYTIHQVKYFSVLICFLAAFFCNMQCVRYYSHSSFLLNVPLPDGKDEFIEYVAQTLNRGSLFWSLGLRAFYFSFPLLLWIFGPIPMFACSCLISFSLYFLDTASLASWYLPIGHMNDIDTHSLYFGSITDSIGTAPSEVDNIYCSLLGITKLGTTNDTC
ncbi:hypothetical protein RND81_06G069900 [Saponaria officinalis]|uniref:Uncharacterized protein n=1 Tax=Saponaria officinalis TaxID=3572 RepID=A0AAW1K803_SAPOF